MSQYPADYISINKKLWDERTRYHIGSDFYDQEGFIKGKSSLKDIERTLLGDIKGKSVLHLQCHFGQDTLSLARMGAQVTGVDLSSEAITLAEQTAAQLGIDADFICCNIYDLPKHLEKQFDTVFTTYGTVGWLPDLTIWAQLVARYMKPGANFIFVEFHPFIWMLDNNFSQIQYSYFNTETIIEAENGTYADKQADIRLEAVSWNHSLDEVIQNLLDAGLTLQSFKEYDYSPYNIFPRSTDLPNGTYQIRDMEGKMPLVYSLKMMK
ncbi:MAG TPA: class I SAM-dependent methyltransferase [Flavipsychrobacter sp.]|nr:class I SAM-dependent methyltransferase [Flavipsychrobacter sp.]